MQYVPLIQEAIQVKPAPGQLEPLYLAKYQVNRVAAFVLIETRLQSGLDFL